MWYIMGRIRALHSLSVRDELALQLNEPRPKPYEEPSLNASVRVVQATPEYTIDRTDH